VRGASGRPVARYEAPFVIEPRACDRCADAVRCRDRDGKGFGVNRRTDDRRCETEMSGFRRAPDPIESDLASAAEAVRQSRGRDAVIRRQVSRTSEDQLPGTSASTLGLAWDVTQTFVAIDLQRLGARRSQ